MAYGPTQILAASGKPKGSDAEKLARGPTGTTPLVETIKKLIRTSTTQQTNASGILTSIRQTKSSMLVMITDAESIVGSRESLARKSGAVS